MIYASSHMELDYLFIYLFISASVSDKQQLTAADWFQQVKLKEVNNRKVNETACLLILTMKILLGWLLK